MSLTPLLSAPPVIQIHAFTAIAAFALGIFQLAAPKGTLRHRATGFAWVALMLTLAVTSFGIHEINLWGIWSPIHILAVVTLVSLPLGIFYAHTHRVQHHRWTMISLFTGALVIAGIFTFVPGRIMHAVVFGG